MTSCDSAKSGFDAINNLFTCELFIPSVGSDNNDDDDAVIYGNGVYTCEAASDLDKVIQSFYLNIQGEGLLLLFLLRLIIL